MLVEFGEPAKVQMTETLVPQHTEGGASKGMHSEKLVDSGSRAVLKLRRWGRIWGTETRWVANDDGQCAEEAQQRWSEGQPQNAGVRMAMGRCEHLSTGRRGIGEGETASETSRL
ncbi:hypothetical protein MHU86_13645 [Fragilaria crotonensis]|nr:hypothetical protein MHU86_13645 [Fragilaria crotonensis]